MCIIIIIIIIIITEIIYNKNVKNSYLQVYKY